MISILYEDKEMIVVKKPAGQESQASRGFAPDLVSEIRNHLAGSQDIHKLATKKSPGFSQSQPPYVGVIHRLDKPVSGIMVYAKSQKAAAALSKALQQGDMKKEYCAVVCGKPVDNQGTYVDYLCQDRKTNTSRIVDKSVENSKRAELSYKVRETLVHQEEEGEKEFSLVEIQLVTGRHHQIRVQFSGHGTPLYGDGRYGKNGQQKSRRSLALCACRLEFPHPVTGKKMKFEITPQGGAFDWFTSLRPSHGSPTHP